MRLSTIAVALALGLAANFAVAQSDTTPPAQDQSSMDQHAMDQQDQNTNRTGDVTSMKNQGNPTSDSAPQKTQTIKNQDTRTGNDQNLTKGTNQGRGTMNSDANMHGQYPDFATMDTMHSGYVTKEEARNHKWLNKNFSKCDTDKDGRISQPEYTTCTSMTHGH